MTSPHANPKLETGLDLTIPFLPITESPGLILSKCSFHVSRIPTLPHPTVILCPETVMTSSLASLTHCSTHSIQLLRPAKLMSDLGTNLALHDPALPDTALHDTSLNRPQRSLLPGSVAWNRPSLLLSVCTCRRGRPHSGLWQPNARLSCPPCFLAVACVSHPLLFL